MPRKWACPVWEGAVGNTVRLCAGRLLHFVIDATMTFPIQNPDVPDDELGVAAIQERTIFVLRHHFARIVNTHELVTELAALSMPLPTK